MTVSIVIPTKDRKPLAVAQLESLEPVMTRNEVIVVDDSTDGTFEELTATYGDRIRVLKGEGRGAVVAANIGLLAARNEKVFLLCDDQRIVGWPDDFMARLEKDFEKAEMVGVHLLSPHVESAAIRKASWLLFSQMFPYAGDQSGYIEWVSIFAIDRSRVKLLFDEGYAGHGFHGESDFQLRAKRAGARLWYDASLQVKQAEEGSLKRPKEGERQRRAKAHEYFLKKNFPNSWFVRQQMFKVYLRAARV